MPKITIERETLEWPEDDKTGDGLPPLPEPDGSAEVNKRPHPGGGYEYDEVDAWSEPLVRAAIAAAVARERERLADPLPAAVVKKIKDECSALGLDYVAFAWRIQKRLASAIRAR